MVHCMVHCIVHEQGVPWMWMHRVAGVPWKYRVAGVAH